MELQTSLWASRSVADARHLGLRCDVVVVGQRTSAHNRFIAEIFGVSPFDELGYARLFGKVDQDISEAIMWFAHISNFYSHDYYLRSNYNITYRGDLIIIHPEEIEAICRLTVFPLPRIWIEDSLGNTVAELAAGEHTVQPRDWFYVSLSRWCTSWC
jgi:hypothetical protein